MIKLKTIFSITALLASSLCATQAQAIAAFGSSLNTAYPGSPVLYNGSCTVCHNQASDDPSWFSLYGSALRQAGADDDLAIAPYISAIENFDYDKDGFTIKQEIYGYSFAGGSLAGTPRFATLPYKSVGKVAAKSTAGGEVSALSYSTTAPAGITSTFLGTATFEAPATLGIDNASDFIFSTGGAQAGATTVYFLDDNDATIVTTNAAAGSGSVLSTAQDGSVHIIVQDEGAYDLYTTAVFQANAIAAYNASTTPYASADPYISNNININPYAKISPLANISPYAFIDAYAVVDAYATIGAYSHVKMYAYIAPNVDLYASISQYTQIIIDPYVSISTNVTPNATTPTQILLPNGVGHIRARVAVATTPPPTRTAPTYSGSGGDTAGGLHCMTSGLGTQGLMFFAMLTLGLFIRKKAL